MSTIELFITSVAVGVAFGVLLGMVALRLWLAHLDRKDRDAIRNMKRQLRQIHNGTPYIAKPGVRTVKGTPMFSSDWLNDGLGPAALPPVELRSVR